MKQSKYIQALMNLGLTFLQATVYSTLVRLGKAEAKVISNASGMARADVYRVMATLEKAGLVEKIITNPTIYRATPIKEGFMLLLENKKQEYSQLRDQTTELIRVLPEFDEFVLNEDQEFILISSEKLSGERIKIEDSKTHCSLDITGDWKSMKAREYHQLAIHEKALKRGVKIRIITEKHEGESFEKLYPSLLKNPLFEIRYVDPPIPIRTAIYDRKRLNMSVRAPTDPLVTPTIWSSNPQFVRVIVAFFEQIWESAQHSSQT